MNTEIVLGIKDKVCKFSTPGSFLIQVNTLEKWLLQVGLCPGLVPLVCKQLAILCRWPSVHPVQLTGANSRQNLGATGGHWMLATQTWPWAVLWLPAREALPPAFPAPRSLSEGVGLIQPCLGAEALLWAVCPQPGPALPGVPGALPAPWPQ